MWIASMTFEILLDTNEELYRDDVVADESY